MYLLFTCGERFTYTAGDALTSVLVLANSVKFYAYLSLFGKSSKWQIDRIEDQEEDSRIAQEKCNFSKLDYRAQLHSIHWALLKLDYKLNNNQLIESLDS